MENLPAELFKYEIFLHLAVADVASARLVCHDWLRQFDQAYWLARWRVKHTAVADLLGVATRFGLNEVQVAYLRNVLCDRRQQRRVKPRPCATSQQRAQWHRAAHFLGLYTRTVAVGRRVVIHTGVTSSDGYDSDGGYVRGEMQVCTHYAVVVSINTAKLPPDIGSKRERHGEPEWFDCHASRLKALKRRLLIRQQ